MYDKDKQQALDELKEAISDFTKKYIEQGTKIKFSSQMYWDENPENHQPMEIAYTSSQIFCEKCERYISLNFESNYCSQCGGLLDSYFREPVGVLWGVGNYTDEGLAQG